METHFSKCKLNCDDVLEVAVVEDKLFLVRIKPATRADTGGRHWRPTLIPDNNNGRHCHYSCHCRPSMLARVSLALPIKETVMKH